MNKALPALKTAAGVWKKEVQQRCDDAALIQSELSIKREPHHLRGAFRIAS
jgi:hypothetical protein